MYGPEEWISRGLTEDDGFLSNTPARTLCPEDSIWRPCRVVGVVAETVLDPSDITLFEVQVTEPLSAYSVRRRAIENRLPRLFDRKIDVSPLSLPLLPYQSFLTNVQKIPAANAGFFSCFVAFHVN
jgi:hypothetical protein